MTCIVGIEQDGKVFIGGDSSASTQETMNLTSIEKVFRNGRFVIGFTSSFRMGQILRYGIDFPIAEVYDEAYMVRQFVETVRVRFRELGFSKIESNEETGGDFLVGVDGKIWHVSSDFQVNRYRDGLYAIGSGATYALGAMKALDAIETVERLTKALEISAYYSPWVKPPFIVLEN